MKEIIYQVKVNDHGTYWKVDGKYHRENGPAVEWADGTKAWYLNNKLHREDGPAVERANGGKEWYLNGEYLTEKEFNQRMNPKPCEGKIVEIEGVKYTLTATK